MWVTGRLPLFAMRCEEVVSIVLLEMNSIDVVTGDWVVLMVETIPATVRFEGRIIADSSTPLMD